ncbi:MAG: peptide chain release factor-like protein [Candidatus Aureabacteria bacterium]|nr:peptide chain release factor-like protein [Candidatus Auribacterota bacterium]
MSLFSVSPHKEQELSARMKRLGIRTKDLEEKFIRSSGHGGQNINKTSTCVFLRHLPSGVSVKCQEERSRALNRFLARRRLVERIDEIRLGRLSDEQQRREKIRRQKRRRSRRARARMLDEKRKHGEKKMLRAAVKDI